MGGMTTPMGGSWVVQSPMGRSVGDHVCWPFRDRGELGVVARAFVMDGLGRDERVAYVGEGGPRDLQRDLVGLPNLQDCLERHPGVVSAARPQRVGPDRADLPNEDPAQLRAH
jgi:hypothetical protein